jgi:hypothetical protein
MLAFTMHLVGGWASLYSGSAVLRTLVSFVHVAGLVGGGGAAVAADRATLHATRKGGAVTRAQIDAIHNTHRIVLAGLAGVIVSGLLLFAADVETYAPSKLFWIKMAMVAALMINGALLVRVGRGTEAPDDRVRRRMRWTAGVSLALWFLTTLAGAGLPNI